eukprot:SAG31_NODE_4906_length_2875_cov_1.441282_3_plen_301_part_00
MLGDRHGQRGRGSAGRRDLVDQGFFGRGMLGGDLLGGGGFGGGFGSLADQMSAAGRNGGGHMYMQSSTMVSDGSNTYRKNMSHAQSGDISETKVYEGDTRSRREMVGMRRGIGERSREVTRTRHGNGDEDINNVLRGVDESEGGRFDLDWQSAAAGRGYRGGGGAPSLGYDREGGQSQSHRQPAQTLENGNRALSSNRSMHGQRSVAIAADQYGSGLGRANGLDQRRPMRDIGPVPAQIGNRGRPASGAAGQARPDRYVRATPTRTPAAASSARAGGRSNGGVSTRAARPQHRVMAPRAD